MDTAIITCSVTKDYKIAVDGVDDKDKCLKYIFVLERRIMLIRSSFGGPFISELRHDAVARNYFDRLVGTPEKLIEFAREGHLDKASLTALLERRIRKMFLSVCDILEKGATKDCGSSKDPWLKNICEFECFKACINIWASKFQYPENRIEIWRK